MRTLLAIRSIRSTRVLPVPSMTPPSTDRRTADDAVEQHPIAIADPHARGIESHAGAAGERRDARGTLDGEQPRPGDVHPAVGAEQAGQPGLRGEREHTEDREGERDHALAHLALSGAQHPHGSVSLCRVAGGVAFLSWMPCTLPRRHHHPWHHEPQPTAPRRPLARRPPGLAVARRGPPRGGRPRLWRLRP